MSTPQLGFGTVWHRRLRPAAHRFHYPSYFLHLPMRQLRDTPCDALHRNQWGALSFHDGDHGLGGKDALAWFEALLQQEGIHDADGEIWLQTYPRVLGYVFKPVSFWYALRADGTLAAVLAEVNNTFGERHAYLLAGPKLAWGRTHTSPKVFHVSPFCRVAGDYAFRFDQRLDARDQAIYLRAAVDLHDEGGLLLQTSLSGLLQPLTPASVRRALWGMPLMTLGVVLRIHWQALRLWRKRVPFFSKPLAPDELVSR